MNSGKPRTKTQDISPDQKRVHFDPSQELYAPNFIFREAKDPLVFNAMELDYNNCEIDPKENPLHIQHAYLNKGEYAPGFSEEQERYIEDINKRINRPKPQEQIKKKLMQVYKLNGIAFDAFKQKSHTKLVDESLKDLRRSGKPFYWVDHDRLKKLKKMCETYKDESVKKQAVSALYEYKETVSNYNSKNKHNKMNDIFPSQKHNRLGDNTKNTEKMVNITNIETQQMMVDDSDSDSSMINVDLGNVRSKSHLSKGGSLPWNVQSFLQ